MARGRKRKAIPKGKNIEELAEELVGKKPPVEEVPVIIEEQTPPVEEEENVVAPVVEEDPLAAHELARGGQKETVDYPVDDFQEIQYESAVNTALILDRHEMPVNKGIFEIEIPKAKMFDYEWYDNIVRNWIFHNVPQNEDGLWEKPLNVYVTGLPAATASVIKTCNDMRVNLTLMHFNYDTRNFEKQVIFNKFPMAQDGVGLGSIFEGDKVKLYHTNVNAIENSNLFYCISKKELVRAKDNQFTTIEHYVTENFNDVWKVFPQLVEDIQKDTSKKICLFCNEVCKRTDGSFFFRKTITKSWNYSLAN